MNSQSTNKKEEYRLNKNWWWLEDQYWLADMDSVMKSHLEFIEKQKKEATSSFYGLDIKSIDGVYHPIEGSSTHFIGDALFGLVQPNTSLLEIGCGTGAISCVAAKLGASRIIATDIGKGAYQCAQSNIDNLQLHNQIKVIESNLFDNVPKEKFDYIIFNAPLLHCEPLPLEKKEYNEIAIDHEGAVMLNFIKNAKPYLKKNGKLLLTISNIGKRKVIEEATLMLSQIGIVSAASAMYRQSGNQWRFILSVSTY